MNFNQLFNFFFINSKINTLLFLDSDEESYSDLCNEGIKAQTIYKKQIRRYLGFGFFLSFIPGTEPFRARKNLLSVIIDMETRIDALDNPWMSFFQTTPFSIFTRIIEGFVIFMGIIQSHPLDFFKGKTGLNRLNPLLYITVVIVTIFLLIGVGLSALCYKLFPDFDPDPSPYILNFLSVILGAVVFVYTIAFLATELTLNSLYALIIDPIIFAFEAILQLFEDWPNEFINTPTEDYIKINRLLASLGEETLNKAHITKELTLVEAPKDKISRFEQHRESVFYSIYKEKDLFRRCQDKIVSSYNLVSNLIKFSYFFKDTLNKDVLSHTVKIGLAADFADIESDNKAQVRP